MPFIQLGPGPEVSRMIHGHWRLAEWGLSATELLLLTRRVMDLGITVFDHADIYGNHTCEALFGDALALEPGIRDRIRIVTKCGILLANPKFPERKIKTYDYSSAHIVASAEQSLRNFRTDRIDLLLLHRPSPFFNPEEAASAFDSLHRNGKVLNFGVSNFTPGQFSMLQHCSDRPLVTNQVEISPYCLEHFENGNIDFFLEKGIAPMAWSPLAGGRLLNPVDEKGGRILDALREVGDELGAAGPGQVAYAWLLMHPSGICPISGSGKIERVEEAAGALNLKMTLEQWFRIYTASTGMPLP